MDLGDIAGKAHSSIFFRTAAGRNLTVVVVAVLAALVIYFAYVHEVLAVCILALGVVFLTRYTLSYIKLGERIAIDVRERADSVLTFEDSRKLGVYYITDETKSFYKFDADGYPIYPAQGGYHIHPTQIVQIALQKFSAYLRTGDTELLAICRKYADYIVKIIKIREYEGRKYGLVSIDFFDKYFPFLGNSWICGLLQGQILSLMLRMHQTTGDEAYKDAADLVYASYFVPDEIGGFRFSKGDDLFFEECVSSPATHILNGHVYAVWGLFDYWRVYGREDTAQMLRLSINTLKRHLERFTLSGTDWTYYDDPDTGWRGLVTPFYQHLHPSLLRVVAKMSDDPEPFYRYADRWDRAFSSPKDKFCYLVLRDYYRVLRLLKACEYRGIPYP